jgi:putative hemolysin
LVNDVLLYVPALRPPFVAVNKYGAQNREAVRKVSEVFESDNQIITFPAGLVSRFRKWQIQDLDWKKAFIVKARESGREVVPVFFRGANTRFFYMFARLRKALGIKFNIELFLLPREFVKSKKKTFDIYIGVPVAPATFDARKTDAEWAMWARAQAYKLPNN